MITHTYENYLFKYLTKNILVHFSTDIVIQFATVNFNIITNPVKSCYLFTCKYDDSQSEREFIIPKFPMWVSMFRRKHKGNETLASVVNFLKNCFF